MSDGTPRLRFLDPATFAVRRVLEVTDAGRPVESLNELEFVRGEVYANVWPTDWIVRIDPVSGRVVSRVDLTGLLAPTSGAAPRTWPTASPTMRRPIACSSPASCGRDSTRCACAGADREW